MLALLKEKCGVGSSDPLNQIALTDYQNASVPEVPIEFNKDKIAVVYASGEIGLEQKNNTIGPELAKTIRKIREDNTVKAIVLRVNSPGGSALTSDIIWRLHRRRPDAFDRFDRNLRYVFQWRKTDRR